MKPKTALLYELISLCILTAACFIGYFSISSTLFYFSAEAFVLSVSLAIFYGRTNRGDRVSSIIVATLVLSAITFFSAYLPSIWSGDFVADLDSEMHSTKQYLYEMFYITWPLIVFKGIYSWYGTLKMDRNSKESELFTGLVIAVFTSFGIGIICLFLFELAENSGNAIVLFSIVLSRILVAFYRHKQIIRSVVFKSK